MNGPLPAEPDGHRSGARQLAKQHLIMNLPRRLTRSVPLHELSSSVTDDQIPKPISFPLPSFPKRKLINELFNRDSGNQDRAISLRSRLRPSFVSYSDHLTSFSSRFRLKIVVIQLLIKIYLAVNTKLIYSVKIYYLKSLLAVISMRL